MSETNRYRLVVLAAQRARQLQAGARPRVEPKGRKPIEIAIEEIEKGLISWHKRIEEEEPEPEAQAEEA